MEVRDVDQWQKGPEWYLGLEGVFSRVDSEDYATVLWVVKSCHPDSEIAIHAPGGSLVRSEVFEPAQVPGTMRIRL
jgi:hypothetical protein